MDSHAELVQSLFAQLEFFYDPKEEARIWWLKDLMLHGLPFLFVGVFPQKTGCSPDLIQALRVWQLSSSVWLIYALRRMGVIFGVKYINCVLAPNLI